MREFLLNSEELLDKDALQFLQHEEKKGLIPCSWIRFNDKIKLLYFTDSYETLESHLAQMSLDDVCGIGKALLKRVIDLEGNTAISLENLVWDLDSLYLNEKDEIFGLCLPAVLPLESLNSQIYKKRVYAILEEMLTRVEGGEEVCRQIEFQKEREFGDWNSLQNALEKRRPEEDETILLKGINTPEPQNFQIGHEKFQIGADPDQVDGLILGNDQISPVHAVIGWNGINFYVMDFNSEKGTYINDQRIASMTQIPIGKGSVLRFADCTFNVE